MGTTPRPLIDSVVQSVCGRAVEQVVPLAGGGMNETYRVELSTGVTVIARIARQPVPWFGDEAHLMTMAREVGVPTPEVLGVVQRDQDGELLSFSIQQFLPGRSLDELVSELTGADLDRLVLCCGELLARVHSLASERGVRHELRVPEPDVVARVARTVDQALGPAAAAVVERGAGLLREQMRAGHAPALSLTQGDFLPKNLLVDDGVIVGVIDWEFAGSASPAFDIARWQVSAGDPLHDRSELLRRGYARVAGPDSTDDGSVPAYVIDWAVELLGWNSPAPPAQVRRCVEVITRYI